jgi:hypothetical protein
LTCDQGRRINKEVRFSAQTFGDAGIEIAGRVFGKLFPADLSPFYVRQTGDVAPPQTAMQT